MRNNIPQYLVINREIAMDQNIPGTRNSLPLNIRILFFYLIGYIFTRLTYYFNRSNKRPG